jgi:transketolase
MASEQQTANKEMRTAFGEMLVELGRENPNIFVLDGDLNTSTRTDLFLSEFPRRFIQCGIAEQNMFGVAAGLAVTGGIPFPTTFAAFAARRACDQVAISIAYPKLNVKIPGCYPGLPTGKAGATHQAIEDLAVMRAMPYMVVIDPGDNLELRYVMRQAVEYHGPVYFRVTRPAVPQIFPDDYPFEWGKAATLMGGSDLTFMGTGFMTAKCLEAAKALAAEGIRARVLHVGYLKPIDREAIVQAAEETGAVVTAENHSVIGGLAGAVAEVLAEEYPVPMVRVGVQDKFVECGEIDDLFWKYGTRVEDLVRAGKQVLEKKQIMRQRWV